MNLRETRIRMERLGEILRKMGAVFEAENIIDRWNGRKIIPLAMVYRIESKSGLDVYITPVDDGFKIIIKWTFITECWYMKSGKYDALVMYNHDYKEIGRIQVKIR